MFTLIGPKNSPIVTRHDWEFIRNLWPTIVKSMPSEKPSIINLISAINESVHKYFPTIAIKLVIPDSCLVVAQQMSQNVPKIDLNDWKSIMNSSETALHAKSENRRKAYDETLNALIDACESGIL